jgi:hypothetical protein
MGGHVFGNTRRYSKEEYSLLERQILSLFYYNKFTLDEIKIIPSYRNKDSFGDMDILIEESKRESTLSILKEYFSLNKEDFSFNSNVVSIRVKRDFQLDLIFTPKEFMETSFNYFSNSDLSNLIGRVYRKTGFKFAHKGLIFVVREGDFIFREIIVSKDWKKMLEFLDYDYEVFSGGFDTLEDIFRFVASSPLFNKEIFLLHNRSHISRVRDKKRETYREFLLWCEREKDLPAYPWESFSERGGYREDEKWLQDAFEHFPGFYSSYLRTMRDLMNWKEVKRKFSGSLVSSLTGLEGKVLGSFIQELKSKFPSKEDFSDFILASSEEKIASWILTNWSKV